MARFKQNELRQQMFNKEEKRDRLEMSIKEGEKRMEKLLETLRNNQDRMKCIDAGKAGLLDKLNDLDLRVAHAKTWGTQIWKQLSVKLAERSQLHYHCTYKQTQLENVKSRVANLEEQLGIVKDKKEMLLKHDSAKKWSVVRNQALIEQIENDMRKSIERCTFARQEYLTLKLYKDSLEAEIENLREMRRDVEDKLRSANRTRENLIINASCRLQYYR